MKVNSCVMKMFSFMDMANYKLGMLFTKVVF